jgi:hypothetical protein
MIFHSVIKLYELKILEPGDAALPLIRMFFALLLGLVVSTKHAPSSAYNTVVYDIWYALKLIKSRGEIWDGLLQASYGWRAQW